MFELNYFRTKMEQSWRIDTLNKIKKRNTTETVPYQQLFDIHNRLSEQNSNLRNENSSLNLLSERLKSENLHLRSTSAPENTGQNNENYLELQKKLFNVQEELTEMHRFISNYSN